MLIEVHGDYWHGKIVGEKGLSKTQIETIYNDSVKQIIAMNNSKKIEYIWENETKNKLILYEKISKILYSINQLAERFPDKDN